MDSNSTLHLGPRLRLLNQAISQDMSKTFTALDLTGAQSFVLRYLSMHKDERIYAKDIEKQFSLSHPTVSGILQRLEAKGFITVVPDPADRRCRRVTLTEKAERCQMEICRHIRETEARMLSGMSAGEVQTLVRLLDQATANLTETPDKEDSQT
jgi:DNA-binding MarR family transcriptional regulator